MKFVLASDNPKKLAEMREILAPFGFSLISQREAGVSGTALETGDTFPENARIKARFAVERTGLPAIADDSGLAVDALHGRPGVYSARYAGGDDRKGVTRLLSEMEHVADGERTAAFFCAVVCLFPDGKEICATGQCPGVIARQPRGEGGFGYDPVFFVPSAGLTFAEMPAEMKNQISHRAKAMAAFREQLAGLSGAL